MSSFTKVDLKDGMRVELVAFTDQFYVTGSIIQMERLSTPRMMFLHQFNDDLTAECGILAYDIYKVTDRDGTILFEKDMSNITDEQKAEVAELSRKALYKRELSFVDE